jgi:S1-C subfamily serine protease
MDDGPQEVIMALATRPLGRRHIGWFASLSVAALLVAACGSAGTSVKQSALGVAEVAQATVVATTPPSVAATASTTLVSSGSAALALQAQMVSVIKQLGPSIVVIETSTGLGSGVVYDNKGDIVTNAHVVGTSTTFKVTLANGKIYSGTLVGSYTADDIAVVHVDAPNLTPATFGDSSKLSVGDFVMAMGNPLGLQSSVTEGIVSAVGRQVSEPAGNALPDAIQTSAAINPGNSGGALVDLSGNVVGIPTLEATDQGSAAAGIGFAISSNRAKLIADQLIAGGKVTNSGRAYLGVEMRDGTNGPVIVALTAGGPAGKAGVQVGDVVQSIDGTVTPDTSTLGEVVASHKPGDSVQVKVQHQDGTDATITVTLGQLPG